MAAFFLVRAGSLIPIQFSNEVRADGGTSILGPGHSMNASLSVNGPGMILIWSYNTTENVEFWVYGPDGVVDHFYPGTEGSTHSAGVWVSTPGRYSFVWTNHEQSSSATVYYEWENYSPINTTLTVPEAGIVCNDLSLNASGTMDYHSSQVSYSLNNVSYEPTSLDRAHSTWSAPLNLSIGNNILFLATMYSSGNFSYKDYQLFSISTGFGGIDFVPELQLQSPSSGSNISSHNTTLYGTCNAAASAVYVSLDNVTFEKASKESYLWNYSLNLSSGSNAIYLREDFQRGNFTYQYYDRAQIIVDPGTQNQVDAGAQTGIGLVLIGLVALLAITYVMVKRKK
jgi:hypothetical protein